MKLTNKQLENLSLILIPIFLTEIYLIKYHLLTIAIFALGIFLQILLYRNYSKENKGREFLKKKTGPILITLVLIIFFVIKYGRM